MEDPNSGGKASLEAENISIDDSRPKTPDTNNSKFINITNRVPFDANTRTRVRVEVMRDYHRKRNQKASSSAAAAVEGDDTNRHESIDPKSRMTKFRLDSEKSLTPWKPLKKRRKRKRGEHEQVIGLDVEGLEGEGGEVGDLATDRNHRMGGGEWSDVWPGMEDFHDTLLRPWDEAGPQHILTHPSILYSPSSYTVDPFVSTSVPITPRIQVLLHHYFNLRLPSSWMMMPMRNAYFALSVHDSALFYTFLSHYAASYHSHYRTGYTLESIFYRTKAIELVNERLRTRDLDEGTVAAVANMAIFDSSNGAKESMKVHLQGLRKMVELRGGLQEGGFSPHVQRLIAWTDINTANILSEKPHFPPLTFNLPKSLEDPPSTAASTLDIVLIILRNLLQTLSAAAINTSPPPQNTFYSDQIYHIQRQLIDLSHPVPLPSPTTPYHHIYPPISNSYPNSNSDPETPAFALALLVFSYRCLRDISFRFGVMYTFTERLQSTILALPASASTAKTLWILTLGAMVSENKPSHGFFLQRLAEIRKRIVWRTGTEGGEWREAREVLSGVLWHVELDEAGERVWTESYRIEGVGGEVGADW